MRKAGVVFAVTFAAVLGAGAALMYWDGRPQPPAQKPAPPPVPPVGEISPGGWAEYAAAVPAGRGGRTAALTRFLDAARQRDRVLDAYQAVGPEEAAEAFRELAEFYGTWAVGPEPGKTRAPATLRELVAAHQARVGPDAGPHLGLYRALLLVWDRKYAEAEPLAARACEQIPEPPLGASRRAFELARRLRTEVEAETGRWADPGPAGLPPGVTYDGLFWYFFDRDRPADADRVLAAWAAAPDDPGAARCRMVADYRQGRYEACLGAADRYLELNRAQASGDRRHQLDHRQDAELKRVRSLARLGRFPEAVAALDRGENRLLPESVKAEVELLVALLAGDEGRADRVLGSGRVKVDWVYNSDDIRPLLLSDRWAALRAKHPPVVPEPRPRGR